MYNNVKKPIVSSAQFFTFLAACLIILLPEYSLAQGADDGTQEIMKAICTVIKALSGPIARGVAAFGIIFLGFSLFLGKISWGTGIALAIGLGAVFGAESIVNAMGEDGDLSCDNY